MPAPPIGAAGQTVTRNIQELTKARGLTLRSLSERLGELGRPILPSVLHALSQGKRRVDADDLMALALALGVNPNSLLLPRDAAPGAEVELAPEVRQPAWAAWAWANGRIPLPESAGTAQERFAREVDFARQARPAFGGRDQAPVLSEVYELADRIQAYGGGSDPVIQGALRDRVLRQVREVALRLEEMLDDDAAVQVRDAVRTLPAAAVGYAGASEQVEVKPDE